MTYKVNRVEAKITNGEARILAATATEVNPDDVEAFAIVTFIHTTASQHDLLVKSNLIRSIEALHGLFSLAIQTTATLGDVSDEHAEAGHKDSRIRTQLRSGWNPFRQ
jgi:hypothetical protein